MMMFCSMELHYIIFLYCILSMRCELYDRDSFVLFYPDYRPWLPGTPFSALFPCFGAGVMGGRHIHYIHKVINIHKVIDELIEYECNKM